MALGGLSGVAWGVGRLGVLGLVVGVSGSEVGGWQSALPVRQGFRVGGGWQVWPGVTKQGCRGGRHFTLPRHGFGGLGGSVGAVGTVISAGPAGAAGLAEPGCAPRK